MKRITIFLPVVLGAVVLLSACSVDDTSVALDLMETEAQISVTTETEPSVVGEVTPAAGSYQTYTADWLRQEQRAGAKTVLFFHAGWCPYCRAADKAFSERSDEIPSGVTVLKTDYDSNSDLKKKYGVTYQHTFVQIDAEGEQISKWTGGDLDNLRTYIK